MKTTPFQLTSTAVAAYLSVLALALATDAYAEAGPVTMSLGEVVVTGEGSALSPRQVLSSVNVLARDRIENQTHYSNFELLSQVPGVMLGEYLGKGLGYGTVSMRGFNGEGVLNAVKLLIDGVPGNANDGNTYYIDMVPRIDIEAIEVVKGTNDPRYGLHNIAGNMNVLTRMGGNYSELKWTAGSFGTQVLQVAKGMETDSFSQNYALSYKTSQGYREHSEAGATSFSGKWFAKSGQGTSRLGLIVKHLDNSADEPGYLSLAQLRADPWQAAPKSLHDRDARRATQVAIQGESDIDSATNVQGQVYWNHLNDDRYIKFPDASRQEFRQLREQHVGASLYITRRLGQTAWGDVVVIGGVDAEQQDNFSFRERPVEAGSIGQNVVPRRDHEYLFNTRGGFVQAVIKPDIRWTITPAYRVDRVDGRAIIRYDTVPGLIGNWPINDYGLIRQPKISSSYKVTDASTLYGNWGRTFQVGTGRAAYQTTPFNAGVSINEGWEMGWKLKPAANAEIRLATWKQTAQSEARTLLGNPSNDTVNLGQTVRRGTDFELNAKPTATTSVSVGASFQKALILSSGKEVDHVPRRVFSLGVTERLNETWRVGATVMGQSSYFIDTTHAEKTGAYSLVNMSLGYRMDKHLELDFQVKNLTNQRYDYAYDNVYAGSPGNFYAPNMPRSFYVTLGMKL